MSEADPRRVEELSIALREQRAIYRIAKSDDGAYLADRLNAMLDQCVGRMISTDDPDLTAIIKGECRGISEVIRIFAEIEDEVIETEELIQVERSDEDI